MTIYPTPPERVKRFIRRFPNMPEGREFWTIDLGEDKWHGFLSREQAEALAMTL